MPEIPFADFGLKWFEDIVGKITEWFRSSLIEGYDTLSSHFFGTPVPRTDAGSLVFGVPSTEPWTSIYNAVVKGPVLVLALLILFVAVQGRHFIRIFNMGSAYEARRTKRKAVTGGILVIAWYWVGVLTLYFAEGLTIALLPSLTELGAAMVDLLPAAASNPMMTLVLASIGGVAMAALKAVYFLREVLLYVYLYAMPIGLAVAFGNLPVLSRIARRLCRQFVPLAFLPIPAALLFRGIAVLLGGDVLDPRTEFLAYLTVAAVPLVALWVTWKTFAYANPMTARLVGTVGRTAATVGAAAAAGYAAGPRAAATTARWGPRAGAGQAAAKRAFGSSDEQSAEDADPEGTTTNDNIATDSSGGVPEYRRRENDPAYY